VSCDALKHRFLDFTKVAFWVGQEEENEFPVPGTNLKHRFSQQYQRRILGFSRGRKLLLRAIQPLESSLYRLEKSLFGWSRSRKWLRSDFDNLNYRFFTFIQIAFWASPGAQNKLRVPCKPLKHHLFDLTQVAFWVGQVAENDSNW